MGRGGHNADFTNRHRKRAPSVGRAADLGVVGVHQTAAEDIDLSQIPEQLRDLYERVVKSLEGRGLQEVDADHLRTYVSLLHLQRLAERDILDRGLWIGTLTGEKPNPSIRTLRDASAQSLRIAEQYGLTTRSRKQMGVERASNVSVLDSIRAEVFGATDAELAKKRRRAER